MILRSEGSFLDSDADMKSFAYGLRFRLRCVGESATHYTHFLHRPTYFFRLLHFYLFQGLCVPPSRMNLAHI